MRRSIRSTSIGRERCSSTERPTLGSDWTMHARDASIRDFRGYGPQPPAVRWPGDARVAVSLVVNVEEGAEFAVSQGDARNERIYDLVEEVVGAPDPCMESHFEYGPRAGWWRIME